MNYESPPKIFLSYCHSDIILARHVEEDLASLPMEIVRDERSTGFTDNLETYMKLIRQSDFALVLVSDAFLRSAACMFEVTEFFKDDDNQERILPVIIEDYVDDSESHAGAKIYSNSDITVYIAYWENKQENLRKSISSVDAVNSAQLIDELRKTVDICRTIGDFIALLRRLKHVTISQLIESGYHPLLTRIGFEKVTLSGIRKAHDLHSQAMKQTSLTKRLMFLDKAINLNPYDVNALISRGITHDEQRNYPEAISDFNRAIQLHPDRQSIYVDRSYAFIRLSKFEDALSDLDKALEMDPECKMSYNNRADVYRRIGKYDLAERDIKSAIALDPDFDLAYATLAELHAVQGNREKFFVNLRRAVECGYPLHKYDFDGVYDEVRQDNEFIALVEYSIQYNQRFI